MAHKPHTRPPTDRQTEDKLECSQYLHPAVTAIADITEKLLRNLRAIYDYENKTKII